MVSKRGKGQPRTCLICSHEIVLLNNDHDFSWDMHKQEDYHVKRLKENNNMSEKADTYICIKQMKEFFGSKNNIELRATALENLANEQLQKSETIWMVLNAIAKAFIKVYPGNFEVRPFGSRITGLTTKDKGDLDLFIDTSSEDKKISLVESPELENFYLRKFSEYMENKESDIWSNVNKILTCRTPIIKVLHYDTRMQCDITVRNGLGNVNTELTSLYIKNISKFKPMILIIREWSSQFDYEKEINSYALFLLVLFYLQQENYAPSVHAFEFCYNQPREEICGYECINYRNVDFDWQSLKSTKTVDLEQLLSGFFTYYTNFDFQNDVICPLLGKPIKKKLFSPKSSKLPKEMNSYVANLKKGGELFKINEKGMNVQDPIDLAHNLTKSSHAQFLKSFIDMCDSSKRALQLIN